MGYFFTVDKPEQKINLLFTKSNLRFHIVSFRGSCKYQIVVKMFTALGLQLLQPKVWFNLSLST